MRVKDMRHSVQFYNAENRFFSFRVYDIKDAYAAVRRLGKSVGRIKVAYYVVRDRQGKVLVNQKLDI